MLRQRWTSLFSGAARCAGLRCDAGARERCAAVVSGPVHSHMRRPMRAVSTTPSPHANGAMLRHRVDVPRLRDSTMHVAVSGASGVGPGPQRGPGISFASCCVAGGLSSVGDDV
jgi:hypothetical protein